MTATLQGGCHCASIRYRIDAPSLSTSICHCVTCRRTAGAQSVAWAVFPAGSFILLRARPARYASSPGVVRTFCVTCGTSLTFQDGPATIDVTLASLDDPEALPPTHEIWLDHRLAWEAVDPDRAAFAAGSGASS